MTQENFFKELEMEQDPDDDEKNNSHSLSGNEGEKNGKLPKPDDGLDFSCENCMDREGGCAQCGWGRKD